MYLQDAPTHTLGQLRDELTVDMVTTVTRPHEIEVDLTNANVIRFPRVSDGDVIEVPATDVGVSHLATLLDVPSKFLQRNDREFQQVVLTELLRRQVATTELRVKYREGTGIGAFHTLSQVAIDPWQIVQVAQQILPNEAPITSWRVTPDDFFFEVIAPETTPQGRLGDPSITPEYQKGDITAAGLRFGLDMKHSLAPTVTPFQYRLVCTNGLQVADNGLKVDARGMTTEQVLHELQRQSQQSFERVAHEVEAFYRLREERVANPERTITRIAGEQGISDRVRLSLIERAAELGDAPTMFDVVNLITNAANAPGIQPRLRAQLQRVGGAVVSDHHARCGHCQSALTLN